MIKLAVSGASGKMGSRIINLASEDKDFQLAAAIEAAGHPDIGKNISGVYPVLSDKGYGGVRISDNIDVVKPVDVLIEFTTSSATIDHLKACVKFSKPIVIGTTGLCNADLSEIKTAAKRIPIVFSPNMSVGVNCLFALVRDAAKKLGLDYEVSIIEAHHIHKKDSPSGTAKKLAQIVKESSGKEPEDIKAVREGEIVGDHKVIFESAVDRLELFHSAKTRDIFAIGALRAARFVVGKKPKLYSMEDVLAI